MRATIHVLDNVVTVDGRSLPIDCSDINQNIRVAHWWDTHGEIEFHSEPDATFRRNGKLDSISEFRDVIEAWQTLAQQLDRDPRLKTMPGRDAGYMLNQINAEPALKSRPLSEAVRLVKKIDMDPDLQAEPISEAVRILEKIEQEPELAERYPGPGLKELKTIESDPLLKDKPIKQALQELHEKESQGQRSPPTED